jgi:hypothetical protein
VDALDDEDPVFRFDLAAHLRGQVSAARVDPARLQRASERAEQSAARRGDHVVESRCVRLADLVRGPAVVGCDGSVHAEDDRLGLSWKSRDPDRTLLADDMDVRYVNDLTAHDGSM